MSGDGDLFYKDARRFGWRRAVAREDHRSTLREFTARQRTLGLLGFWMIIMFALSNIHVFVMIAIFSLDTSTAELRRFRATGRSHQSNRSVEVIGI